MYPDTEDYSIYVFVESRQVMVDKFYDRDLDILYDLIKANIVIKE